MADTPAATVSLVDIGVGSVPQFNGMRRGVKDHVRRLYSGTE